MHRASLKKKRELTCFPQAVFCHSRKTKQVKNKAAGIEEQETSGDAACDHIKLKVEVAVCTVNLYRQGDRLPSNLQSAYFFQSRDATKHNQATNLVSFT